MIYELFEWSLTFLMANGAEDYNGQQGDSWDAHKDMALAMLGSLISACLCLIYFKKTKRLYLRRGKNFKLGRDTKLF